MKKKVQKPKILAIVGPTSTGKSSLAVDLATQFFGEIVSADSRQVYRGLDVATGKITKKEMRGIPHHLLSIADPKDKFTVSNYQKLGTKAIEHILNKASLPIICGGTGFYIDTLLYNAIFPQVKPNETLRKDCDQKTTEELYELLQNLDPRRAKTIDAKNKRRIIRAIEIIKAIGCVPRSQKANSEFDVLKIGLDLPDEELRKNIKVRTEMRIEHGMLEEAEHLVDTGLTRKRMIELGLEYRILAQYLQGQIAKQEIAPKIMRENWLYAKRQRTWFKRDNTIEWFNGSDNKNVSKRVKTFLAI